jgi:hypothetical protein
VDLAGIVQAGVVALPGSEQPSCMVDTMVNVVGAAGGWGES